MNLMLGDQVLFNVPAYELVHFSELAFYAILGVIGGFVSVFFVRLLLKIRQWFLDMPERTRWFQPVAGGLTVGLLGFFVPDVLGVGYDRVGDALNGTMTIWFMALLVVLKLIATATCYGSGNAGGIFGPSLFIGGHGGRHRWKRSQLVVACVYGKFRGLRSGRDGRHICRHHSCALYISDHDLRVDA